MDINSSSLDLLPLNVSKTGKIKERKLLALNQRQKKLIDKQQRLLDKQRARADRIKMIQNKKIETAKRQRIAYLELKRTRQERAALRVATRRAVKPVKTYLASEETRAKMKETQINHQKLPCSVCGGVFKPAHLQRWHGGNCRYLQRD
jgi:ribosomal protein S27AE